MRYYVALVHKETESDFGVSFPDFPGCVSAGSTLAEAAAMAAEALNGHVDLMAEEGGAIPEASSLDEVLKDPDNRDGVPVMVALIQKRSSRAVRVNITVPEDVLGEIDAYAEQHGMNRSGFLVRAARHEMDDKRERDGRREAT